MRNRGITVCSGLRYEPANRVAVLMLAMGIDAELERHGRRYYDVVVAHEDVERAEQLLADEFPDGIGEEPEPWRDEDPDMPTAWFGRGSSAVFALIAVCVAVHLALHAGPEALTRSRLLAAGAIADNLVSRGELWRLFTAVFIHFNLGHLLGNMATFLVVGPPLAQLLGPWRFTAMFVATGVLANVASHFLDPVSGLKAGASGAIAGVLGALGGLALRRRRQQRKAAQPWLVLGAMAAFYAMLIGFGPGRDNVAHVAGIVCGIALGSMIEAPAAAAAIVLCLLLAPWPAQSTEPVPGTVIDRNNAEEYTDYLGPSLQWAFRRGMRMEVVPTRPIPLEPARLLATQKYYAQVTLSEEKNRAENYVAGLPFPFADANDPDAPIKLMLDYDARIVVDDLDVRNFECDTGNLAPDRGMSVERHFLMGHFRRLYYVSRLYHEPMPTWPTADGIRYREVMHPIVEPFDLKGVGISYSRYLDPYRQDDSWLYYPLLKRVRRLSSAQRSDALFGQDADIDSYGGYAGNPAWMDWKLLGTRKILAAMHTRNFPGQWLPPPADFMFDDTWEMREVYVLEGRSRLPDYAYAKRVIYLDRESFVIPYTEMYDNKGTLWKAWVNQFKLGRAPFPGAKRVVYDYDQQFLPALVVFDMQLEHATRCLLPSPAFPREEGWYFNFGDAEGTSEDPFLISNIIASGR